MGQTPLSDSGLIAWICDRVLGGAKALCSGSERLWGSPVQATGESVHAEIALEPDHEKTDEALCFRIRLKKRGPGRHRERFIYIRHVRASRRLSQPRAWRPLGRFLKERQSTPKKNGARGARRADIDGKWVWRRACTVKRGRALRVFH